MTTQKLDSVPPTPPITQADLDDGWLPINPDGTLPAIDDLLGTGYERDWGLQ